MSNKQFYSFSVAFGKYSAQLKIALYLILPLTDFYYLQKQV